jgi:uncharacterized protein (DUF427 family)
VSGTRCAVSGRRAVSGTWWSSGAWHRGGAVSGTGGEGHDGRMAKAIWQGAVIAESDETQVVDGYTYFPPETVEKQFLRDSTHHSVCGWKGTASYYDVVVGEQVNAQAAWYYPTPKDAAQHIGGWIAFWKGVAIEA